MKMQKRIYYLVASLLLVIWSCKQDITNVSEKHYTLELSRDTMLFDVGAGMKSVEIKTSEDSWEATYDNANWYTATEFRDANDYEMITIAVDSCTELSSRESVVTITAGPYEKQLHIIQIGNQPSIYLTTDSLFMDRDTAVVDIRYVSNIDFNIENSSSWFQVEKSTVGEDKILRIKIRPNNSGASRESDIVLKQIDGTYSTSLFVAQSADLEPYQPFDVADVTGNKQIPVVGSAATSTLAGFELSKAYDGNMEIYFQSDWQETDPIEFSFTLNAGTDKLNYLIYYPSAESSKQSVKTANVYTRVVGSQTFSLVGLKTFDQLKPTLITLAQPLANVEEVKFTVVTTFGDTGTIPAASCAEVEFYTTSPLYADIFTDNTCSELVPGITMDKILNIQDQFYRNLAKHLYNGTYESERIMNVSAIQLDRTVAKVYKASLYEHASGIQVVAGEEVVVFVGTYSGTAPSLIVQNATTTKEYTLMEGVNKLTPTITGKVYVKNPVAVKVHIAGGTVDGVYTVDSFEQALSQETDDDAIVDILANKAHLLVPVSYAGASASVLSGINANLTEIIDAAQTFYGVGTGTYQVGSRLGIFVSEQGTALESVVNLTYAELEAIAASPGSYNETLFSALEKIGTAYEPYVNKLWGLSGVSSKLFALEYVYQKYGVLVLKTKGVYATAFQNIIVTDVAYLTANDAWSQVVPLWQLHRYVKDVVGVADFYAQLTYKVKQLTTVSDYAVHLANFTNQVTNRNFAVFFDKWNIGTPNNSPTTVAPGGLHYYIDDNKALYVTMGALTKGTFYPALGGYPTLYNFKNVVGVEIYNAGFLAHVENYQSGTLYNIKWTGYKTNMKIVAIGPDGTTMQVN